MLQDLAQLKRQAEESVSENLSIELKFDNVAKMQLFEVYQEAYSSYSPVLQDNLIKITNSNSQAAYLPFNWFARIRHCRSIIAALQEYAVHAEELKKILEDSTMRALPALRWRDEIVPEQKEIIDTYIQEHFSGVDDRSRFNDFLSGEVWLDRKGDGLSGKKLNRKTSDYIASCVTSICKLINDTAGKLEHFISIYIEKESVRSIIDSLSAEEPREITIGLGSSTPIRSITTGHNKIYYGAPGTGKSYSLEQGLDESQLIRTVFHPDTQYSDFVGCLKPVMEGGSVTYQFRAGPFTEALIKAVNDPLNSYNLVIEEINRAAAAAVFGEIFQLLDREEDGSSSYAIDISDPDLLNYLNSHTSSAFSSKKIKLPSNLSLLATMNSSDQAVMPMDTAFKRRWEFEYLRIDYSKASRGELTIRINGVNDVESCVVPWADFARIINDILISERIAEDRLLGHRFISENELKAGADHVLKGKLFMYLWDDVLRHGQHTVIFRESVDIDGTTTQITNFGQLISAYEQGAAVFNEVVESALSQCLVAPAESEVTSDGD
ncbi:McrB family protein [Vibrio sp. DNB22_19_1]